MTGKLNFGIYGAKYSLDGWVADSSNIISTFSHTFTKTREVTDASRDTFELTITIPDVEIEGNIEGSMFFISLQKIAYNLISGNPMIVLINYSDMCEQARVGTFLI